MRNTIKRFLVSTMIFLIFPTISLFPKNSTQNHHLQFPTPTSTPTSISITSTPQGSQNFKDLIEDNFQLVIGALIGLIVGILTWYLKPIFENLSNETIKFYSKLGQGWGFERKYLAHLIEEYKGLNIKGLKTKAPISVPLEKIYVSLRTELRGNTHLEDPSTDYALSVSKVLEQSERLVLLGGPGTGKSTLLAFLTITYAERLTGRRLGFIDKKVPIVVPLRQLRQVLSGKGSTFIEYLNKRYKTLGLAPPSGYFERKLSQGNCLVLLDGLDEVANEVERRRLSEWVDNIVTIYPKNRFIITSRPWGYDKTPLENGFSVFSICDFTTNEINEFINNWCLSVEIASQGDENETAKRKAAEASQGLVYAIEHHTAIRKLAVNPLMLSIIALVHRYRATLPERRVDLYTECVDVLLGYWDEAKGLAGALSPGEKRALLQPLAFKLHLEKQRDIHRKDLETFFSQLMPSVGAKRIDAGEFLNEIKERSGLLIEIGLDFYTFSHQTFQEFLCAKELVDNQTIRSVLTEKAGDEWWQEVILLYAGLTEATQIIDSLLLIFEKNLKDIQPLLLAGKCIHQAIRVDGKTRSQVLASLQIAFEKSDINDFFELGLVLATISKEEPVGFFLRKGYTSPNCVDLISVSIKKLIEQSDQKLREENKQSLFLIFSQDKELRVIAGTVIAYIWKDNAVTELKTHDVSYQLLEIFADILSDIDVWLIVRSVLIVDEFPIREILIGVLTNLSTSILLAMIGSLPKDRQMENVLAEVLDRKMISIPSGNFFMGYEKRNEKTGSFFMDMFPVTNLQYRRFLDDNLDYPVPFNDEPWAQDFNWDRNARTFPMDKADHPVVLVTWNDAQKYATWAKKQLPSEKEWEKAARGEDARIFPWGNEDPTNELCNYNDNEKGTTPIGKYLPQGDSPYGCVDMAGNVWEWTDSEYDENYKVLKGGSWYSPWGVDVRTVTRTRGAKSYALSYIGFRCARHNP